MYSLTPASQEGINSIKCTIWTNILLPQNSVPQNSDVKSQATSGISEMLPVWHLGNFVVLPKIF